MIEFDLQMGVVMVFLIFAYVVSWALEIIPGLKEWWTKTPFKMLVMFVGCLLIPIFAWALRCYTVINMLPTPTELCGWNGAVLSFMTGIFAFAANQTGWSTGAGKLPNARARFVRKDF